MGKSDKKVKSDRINALRKQYDAFLEEDKRRKERNEYILGRLDKMRYCTAVVPLRHKPTLFTDRREHFSTSSSLSQSNKSSLDIPIPRLDEAAVLREISKKYILIPKIRSSTETENISLPTFKSVVDESGDWKSKYEILDQLKKREKESDALAFGAELAQCNNSYDELQERESDALIFDTEHAQQHYNGPQKLEEKKCDTKGYKGNAEQSYEHDIPEKDKEDKKPTKINPFEKKMEYEYYPFADLTDQTEKEEPQTAATTSPQNYVEFNNNSEKMATNPCIKNEPESTMHLDSTVGNQTANIQNYPMDEYSGNIDSTMYGEKNFTTEEDKDIADTENVYPEDIQLVEILRPDDFVKQINTTPANLPLENIEQEQFPIKPINMGDFTPENNVTLQDGVNINPEVYAMETVVPTNNFNTSSEIVENIENPIDTSGIEAFEAEHREMFYPEGENQNYDYNQEHVAEGYNQEPMQGGEYNQGETAVYYEGYEAEQAYPADIGEHDEATQRYDPHYEQQYATDYVQPEYNQEGYEQQVYAPDPQYEENMNQIQNGLEHLQYEQHQEYETVENIQQQLDTEQAYGEQVNMINNEKPIEDLQKQPTEQNQQAEIITS